MADFPRDEVEAAFVNYWVTGCVRENWEAWVDLFVDDVEYVDHWWGPLHGKEEVKVWIAASMGGVPEMYTAARLVRHRGREDRVPHGEPARQPRPRGPALLRLPGRVRPSGTRATASSPRKRTSGTCPARGARRRSTSAPARRWASPIRPTACRGSTGRRHRSGRARTRVSTGNRRGSKGSCPA